MAPLCSSDAAELIGSEPLFTLGERSSEVEENPNMSLEVHVLEQRRLIIPIAHQHHLASVGNFHIGSERSNSNRMLLVPTSSKT
jgi:hypothetical protein